MVVSPYRRPHSGSASARPGRPRECFLSSLVLPTTTIVASSVVAAARGLPMHRASRPRKESITIANTAAQPSGARNGATMRNPW